MKKLPFVLYSFVSILLMISAAGCGEDATGPSEGEDGWKEYVIEDFTYEWKTEDSLSSVRIRITAPTTGWVAVGFEPTAYMRDANLLVGYVESGTVYVRDDFGTGQVTHDADTNLGGTSDVEILDGSESSTETTIEFRIPMNSQDQYDKELLGGVTYSMIFAYGYDGADDYTSVHEWAGLASIEL